MFCRDRGWSDGDEGALCLSWRGYVARTYINPDKSLLHLDADRHKAPTPHLIHPLSLQDPLADLVWSSSSLRQEEVC